MKIVPFKMSLNVIAYLLFVFSLTSQKDTSSYSLRPLYPFRMVMSHLCRNLSKQ
ncbi:Uncharacterised protein [Segatella copri]|nr:Uncharacterised protein [Segatella copri]